MPTDTDMAMHGIIPYLNFEQFARHQIHLATVVSAALVPYIFEGDRERIRRHRRIESRRGATHGNEGIIDSGLELDNKGEDHDVESDARGCGENRQGGEENSRFGAPIFIKHVPQRLESNFD